MQSLAGGLQTVTSAFVQRIEGALEDSGLAQGFAEEDGEEVSGVRRPSSTDGNPVNPVAEVQVRTRTLGAASHGRTRVAREPAAGPASASPRCPRGAATTHVSFPYTWPRRGAARGALRAV